MSYRILLVEQDETLANLLTYNWQQGGDIVEWCRSDADVIRVASDQSFDIIILDIAYPGLKGLETLVKLKKNENRTPCILLSKWTDEEIVVRALELGAEIFIPKPFSYAELNARIRAIIRRVNGHVLYPIFTNQFEDNAFHFGFLEVFPKRLEMCLLDRCIQFKPFEFQLLFHLLKHPGTIFSKNQLGAATGVTVARIANVISVLRKKLLDTQTHIQILTVTSIGYKLIQK